MSTSWGSIYNSHALLQYRRKRTAFAAKVYGLLIFWLVLAFVQWMVVCMVKGTRSTFKKFYYISLIAFVLAILLLAIYIFVNRLRSMRFLNLILTLIIVELQIVATFILVVISWGAEILIFFVATALLIFLFILIGITLPRKMDLTLDVAVLFVVAFIFLIIAVFALTIMKTFGFKIYTYLVVELAATLTILLFVIYHAQTIHGHRFAEMHDFLMGSLMMFHDFLIIFWLTFYWQVHFAFGTPNAFFQVSTGATTSAAKEENAEIPPDDEDIGSHYDSEFDDYDRRH